MYDKTIYNKIRIIILNSVEVAPIIKKIVKYRLKWFKRIEN